METLDEFFKKDFTPEFKCLVGYIIYSKTASEQEVLKEITGSEAMIGDKLFKWADI